jgi:hypothetical protein
VSGSCGSNSAGIGGNGCNGLGGAYINSGCACRDCIFNGRISSNSPALRFDCPYNKRVILEVLENINNILAAVSPLVENLSVVAGVKQV